MKAKHPDIEISNDELIALLQVRAKNDPALISLAENIFKELKISVETDSAKKWANIVRSRGAALVHGKLHPDWFSDKSITEIEPLKKEPSFDNAGEIGFQNQYFISRSPLSDKGVDILTYGQLDGADVRITPGTQILLISPPQSVDSEYNTKTLANRFQESWNELMWIGFTKPDQNVPFDRTNKIELKCKLFMSNNETNLFLEEISKTPEIMERTIHELWPNLPINLIAKDRLFVKKLTVSDMSEKYTKPFIGGSFIPYE